MSSIPPITFMLDINPVSVLQEDNSVLEDAVGDKGELSKIILGGVAIRTLSASPSELWLASLWEVVLEYSFPSDDVRFRFARFFR